jgi:hypothetical protein
MVYPLPHSNQSYTTERGARLFNASRIQMNVPVVMSNVTCHAMDPTGFRSTLNTGGSIEETVLGSDREYQDHMDGTHLNLTHPVLADFQCEDSWFSCGDHACTDNDTRCTDTILSLEIDFDPKQPNHFVQLLYASELRTTTSVQWASPTGWPNFQLWYKLWKHVMSVPVRRVRTSS